MTHVITLLNRTLDDVCECGIVGLWEGEEAVDVGKMLGDFTHFGWNGEGGEDGMDIGGGCDEMERGLR